MIDKPFDYIRNRRSGKTVIGVRLKPKSLFDQNRISCSFRPKYAPNIPLMEIGFQRLKAALGSETYAMMSRREAERTTSHPEYQAAVSRCREMI